LCTWLPILASTTTQFLATDFQIGSGTVWLSISKSAVVQFSLPISELAATQSVAADF
jgi:hypothetical protein